jgi:peptide/nickel transport system permease protein
LNNYLKNKVDSVFKHRSKKLEESEEYVVLSEWQLMWRKFLKHRVAVAAAIILIILYIVVVFADFFSPYGMLTNHTDYLYTPPEIDKIRFIDSEGKFHIRPFMYRQIQERDPKTLRFIYKDDTSQKDFIKFFVHGEEYTMLGFIKSDIHFFGAGEGKIFLLGTDIIGRDMLTRIIFGGRISLSIGIIGVIILVILGTIMGTISGYFGGWIDNGIQRLIEILRTIPQVALWMALAAIIPKDWPSTYVYLGIVIIFGFISWTGLARELRGKVLAIRRSDYIYAAEISGASTGRIIFRHIIPNVSSHIIVIATLSIPMMIIGEAALSFLGLGIKPPMTSWGLLLTKLREVPTFKHYPWLIIPAGFIVVSVLCFNFVGDALRDVSDPYSK